MSLIGIGDLAQSNAMRHHTAQTKADLTRRSQELASGKAIDTPRHLSGAMGPLVAIDTSLARLDGFGAVTREFSLFADAMQAGLSTISDVARQTANGLMAATGTALSSHIGTATAEAHSALRSTMSTLNLRFGDRSLFAGTATDGPAMASPDTFLTAIEAAIALAGASDVATVEAAIDAWMAAPGGFSDTCYLGSTSLVAVPLGPDEMATLDVTADDQALRNTLKGFAMAALVDRGLFSGQFDLKKGMTARAGEVLLTSETGRTELSARLGGLQAQVDRTQTRNESEATALGIARVQMVAIDPYESATRLQDAEAQLELLYTITARISRLNLADYL